jgi:hypothetical protein
MLQYASHFLPVQEPESKTASQARSPPDTPVLSPGHIVEFGIGPLAGSHGGLMQQSQGPQELVTGEKLPLKQW